MLYFFNFAYLIDAMITPFSPALAYSGAPPVLLHTHYSLTVFFNGIHSGTGGIFAPFTVLKSG